MRAAGSRVANPAIIAASSDVPEAGIVMKKSLLALLLLLLPLLQVPAQAATFVDKNLAQLVTEAEQIFVGSVASVQSRKLPNGAIVTDFRFSDVQFIKGESTATDIVLLALGGEVDGLRLEIPGLPQFQRGGRYLVFSSGNGKDMFPVVGGPAGMFQIIAGTGGGGPIVLNSSGMPLGSAITAEITRAAASPAPGAMQPPVTLESFLAAIKSGLGR